VIFADKPVATLAQLALHRSFFKVWMQLQLRCWGEKHCNV